MRESHSMPAPLSARELRARLSPKRDDAAGRGGNPLRLIAGGVLVVMGCLVAYEWWVAIASHSASKFMFMMSATLILMGVHAVATQFGLTLFGGEGSDLGTDFDLGDFCGDDGDGDC